MHLDPIQQTASATLNGAPLGEACTLTGVHTPVCKGSLIFGAVSASVASVKLNVGTEDFKFELPAGCVSLLRAAGSLPRQHLCSSEHVGLPSHQKMALALVEALNSNCQLSQSFKQPAELQGRAAERVPDQNHDRIPVAIELSHQSLDTYTKLLHQAQQAYFESAGSGPEAAMGEAAIESSSNAKAAWFAAVLKFAAAQLYWADKQAFKEPHEQFEVAVRCALDAVLENENPDAVLVQCVCRVLPQVAAPLWKSFKARVGVLVKLQLFETCSDNRSEIEQSIQALAVELCETSSFASVFEEPAAVETLEIIKQMVERCVWDLLDSSTLRLHSVFGTHLWAAVKSRTEVPSVESEEDERKTARLNDLLVRHTVSSLEVAAKQLEEVRLERLLWDAMMRWSYYAYLLQVQAAYQRLEISREKAQEWISKSSIVNQSLPTLLTGLDMISADWQPAPRLHAAMVPALAIFRQQLECMPDELTGSVHGMAAVEEVTTKVIETTHNYADNEDWTETVMPEHCMVLGALSAC